MNLSCITVPLAALEQTTSSDAVLETIEDIRKELEREIDRSEVEERRFEHRRDWIIQQLTREIAILEEAKSYFEVEDND